jgi:transposase
LPGSRRGALRVDDRCVISGIVHVLRVGTRWRDCPREYGPYAIVSSRFNRGGRHSIRFEGFETFGGSSAITGTVAIDSSTLRAHRSAGGREKRGSPSRRHSLGKVARNFLAAILLAVITIWWLNNLAA